MLDVLINAKGMWLVRAAGKIRVALRLALVVFLLCGIVFILESVLVVW